MEQGRFLIWRTVSGETKRLHGFEVTPEAQAIGLRLPFARFILTRPLAVNVSKDGINERIPVVDVTRLAQVSLLVSTFLVGLILQFVNLRREQVEKRSA